MNIIELKNACYKYPDGTRALNEINIKIEHGKKIAFLGENGSGKSTLFLMLNVIYKLEKGEYLFKGEKINYNKKDLKTLIKNIGVVFQDPDVQLFASTVFQEISFGPKNLGYSDEETAEKVLCAMQKTDVTFLKEKPTTLILLTGSPRILLCTAMVSHPWT